MTNEELIEKLKEAASDLSYYNAAEGDSWSKERLARQQARENLAKYHSECILAGLDPSEILKDGHYLL
jgi:hypothetical protein